LASVVFPGPFPWGEEYDNQPTSNLTCVSEGGDQGKRKSAGFYASFQYVTADWAGSSLDSCVLVALAAKPFYRRQMKAWG